MYIPLCLLGGMPMGSSKQFTIAIYCQHHYFVYSLSLFMYILLLRWYYDAVYCQHLSHLLYNAQVNSGIHQSQLNHLVKNQVTIQLRRLATNHNNWLGQYTSLHGNWKGNSVCMWEIGKGLKGRGIMEVLMTLSLKEFTLITWPIIHLALISNILCLRTIIINYKDVTCANFSDMNRDKFTCITSYMCWDFL